MTNDNVVLGKFTRVVGLKGHLWLQSYTDPPPALVDYEMGLGLRLLSEQGVMLKVAVVGIETREAAEGLVGQDITVPRAALKTLNTDEFYHADLIGQVLSVEGEEIPAYITAVHNHGAGDVLEIMWGEKQYLVPFQTWAVWEMEGGWRTKKEFLL
jgi:16S rRNA processing protein RimM